MNYRPPSSEWSTTELVMWAPKFKFAHGALLACRLAELMPSIADGGVDNQSSVRRSPGLPADWPMAMQAT